MLSLNHYGARLCDGLSRREWLRIGGLSAFGVGLPQLMQTRANAVEPLLTSGLNGSFGKAKSCIVLFLLGGPPQHETWDPKPDAPSEIRGDLGTIATATPGLRIGELMQFGVRICCQIVGEDGSIAMFFKNPNILESESTSSRSGIVQTIHLYERAVRIIT